MKAGKHCRTKRRKENMPKTPKLSYVSPTDRLLKKAIINSIEQLTGRHKLEKMYATALQNYGTQTSFWEAAISALQLKVVYDQARLATIPEQGPIVFSFWWRLNQTDLGDAWTTTALACRFRRGFSRAWRKGRRS